MLQQIACHAANIRRGLQDAAGPDCEQRHYSGQQRRQWSHLSAAETNVRSIMRHRKR